MRKRLVIGVIAAFLIALSVGVRSLIRGGAEASGDGVLTDSGLFSYHPRHQLTFPVLQLSKDSNYVLRFSAMPRSQMTFLLESVDLKAAGWKLENQSVRLDVKISHADGRVVAQADAPLSEWILQEGAGEQALWHTNLRDLRFDAGTAYRMTIQLAPPRNGLKPQLQPLLLSPSRPLAVRPVIEGGGIELP